MSYLITYTDSGGGVHVFSRTYRRSKRKRTSDRRIVFAAVASRRISRPDSQALITSACESHIATSPSKETAVNTANLSPTPRPANGKYVVCVLSFLFAGDFAKLPRGLLLLPFQGTLDVFDRSFCLSLMTPRRAGFDCYELSTRGFIAIIAL